MTHKTYCVSKQKAKKKKAVALQEEKVHQNYEKSSSSSQEKHSDLFRELMLNPLNHSIMKESAHLPRFIFHMQDKPLGPLSEQITVMPNSTSSENFD